MRIARDVRNVRAGAARTRPRAVRAAVHAVIALASLLGAAQPVRARDFVPELAFAGHSTGTGTLRIAFGRPRPFTVGSSGTLREDGRFVLDQTIRFEGRPVETRTWTMRRTGPGAYAATLTDAAGPVRARTFGACMTLRYPLTRWGLVMHQTLVLADDGRSIDNTGRITLLGLPFGRLHETIRHVP